MQPPRLGERPARRCCPSALIPAWLKAFASLVGFYAKNTDVCAEKGAVMVPLHEAEAQDLGAELSPPSLRCSQLQPTASLRASWKKSAIFLAGAEIGI